MNESEVIHCFLRTLRPWRSFDRAQDMLCAKYSEFDNAGRD